MKKLIIIIIISIIITWSIGRPLGSLVTTNLKLFRTLSILQAKEGWVPYHFYLFLRLSFFAWIISSLAGVLASAHTQRTPG